MKARDALDRFKLLFALGVMVALVLPAAAPGDTLPTVSGEEASEVGVTTVKLSGQVDPNGVTGDGNTTWRLQWSPAGTDHGPEGEENWNFAGDGTIEPEAGATEVEATVGFGGELQPGQEYEFRLQAENGAGQAETAAPYPTFTMDAANPPVLAAEPASGVSIVSAHLSGTVDPEGGNVNPIGPEAMPIHWELQYSTDGSSWNTAGSGDITGAEAEGTTPIAVGADATGLTAATGYQVRLHAYSNSPTFALFVEADSPGPNPSFETDPATAPTLTIAPAEGVTGDSAHLSGTIDPEGGNEDALAGVLPIQWELQVNREGEGWNMVGSGELTGAQAESDTPIDVAADATGLVPNSAYKARLLARYAGLEKTSGEEEFETPAVAPTIERETLFNPTATSIQLRALVNPHNAALTECHFEYGTGGALDRTAPCESLPDGNGFTPVAAEVSGLAPGTEYEFRLVATNSGGSAEGDVRSFTSLEEAAPETCANEAIRKAQHAGDLAHCRAWEMVSPLDKGHGDIVGDGFTTVASVEGDAVAFNSRTPFGDTIGSGVSGQSNFVARRSATGWITRAVTPTPDPEAKQVFFAPTRLQWYSEDLRTGIVWAYDLPAVSGDTPKRNNIYLEDTATRALEAVTVSQVATPTLFDFLGNQVWGYSADARHIAFVTPTQFLPDGAAPGYYNGSPNIYQWDEGVLSLAGILPDGTVPAGGSLAASADPIDPISEPYKQAMSADGSRLLFRASGGGHVQLYQRVDGNRTVWISQPEGEGLPEPEGVALEAATPDGRNVFFTAESPLLPEDTNGGVDLYRYRDSADPAADDNLTMITDDGSMGGGYITGEVVGTSDDGDRVYFWTSSTRLGVFLDHGSTRLITGQALVSKDYQSYRFGVFGYAPGSGRVTPDGGYVAFATSGGSNQDMLGNTTNKHIEFYLYSLADDTLVCVSCPAGGATSDATVQPEVTSGSPGLKNHGFRPRFLGDRGQVFFSTADPLVPEDVNGVLDAYEFDPATGRASLLSSGTGSAPATFADAGADGGDVFLVTRDQLVPSDSDELVDVYDVRAGGGYREAVSVEPAPCQAESCQGAPGAPPAPSLATSRAAGKGNVAPRRHPCPKRKAGRKRGAKAKHCPRRHRSKKTRSTDNDRRTAR